MFSKGTMRDVGIDVTIKNNPEHVLAPDDWEMVRKVKLRKISTEEYKTWYLNLLRKRWETRREEILDLVKRGRSEDIRLKCYCPAKDSFCHANLAAKFLNALMARISPNGNG